MAKLDRKIGVYYDDDGVGFAVLQCFTGSRIIAVRNQLPDNFNQLEPFKKKYWTQKNIRVLENRLKRELKARNIVDVKPEQLKTSHAPTIMPEAKESPDHEQ